MSEHDEDELDFLGGSMKDLMAKMGEIDATLDDIQNIDTEKKSTTPKSSTFIDVHDTFEDDDDDDDHQDEGKLDDLAKELNAAAQDDDKWAVPAFKSSTTSTPTPNPVTPQDPMSVPLPRGIMPVTEVETIVTETVTKPSPDTAVGISMKTSKGKTRIVGLNPNGLLMQSGDCKLKVGYEIVSINGQKIQNGRQARHIIMTTPDKVTIEARFIEYKQLNPDELFD